MHAFRPEGDLYGENWDCSIMGARDCNCQGRMVEPRRARYAAELTGNAFVPAPYDPSPGPAVPYQNAPPRAMEPGFKGMSLTPSASEYAPSGYLRRGYDTGRGWLGG